MDRNITGQEQARRGRRPHRHLGARMRRHDAPYDSVAPSPMATQPRGRPRHSFTDPRRPRTPRHPGRRSAASRATIASTPTAESAQRAKHTVCDPTRTTLGVRRLWRRSISSGPAHRPSPGSSRVAGIAGPVAPDVPIWRAPNLSRPDYRALVMDGPPLNLAGYQAPGRRACCRYRVVGQPSDACTAEPAFGEYSIAVIRVEETRAVWLAAAEMVKLVADCATPRRE
jgi:hypothetical protein